MMRDSAYYFFVLLCCSITKLNADSVRYYYDYECNEPLVENAKLTATSSLRDRGPDNAKLYDFVRILSKHIPKKATEEEMKVTGLIHRQVCKQFRKLIIWPSKFTQSDHKTIHTNMEDQFNIRWAFDANAWEPVRDEILMASSYIQVDEKQRISKFVFQDDAKSSLLGRLMLRKFVHLATSMPYEEIRFGRDDHGKPYLMGAGDVAVRFNVSHQGDYVVLAGNSYKNIGIDVMKIEPPVNKNIPEFFRIMTRQFSQYEWATIRNFPTEMEQIACFYRLWCLKESYVKNIGFGITVPLDQISFSIKTPKLERGVLVTDTMLHERNVLKKDWMFEETLLDDKHAVAVSLQLDKQTKHVPGSYTLLTFEALVKEAKPLYDSDSIFCDDFMNKQTKNF